MKKLGVQIIVIDNGFVHVGDCSRTEDGSLRIDNCKNIRQWGTTKGIGELRSGPTKNTVVEPVGTVIVPANRVLFFIETTRESWFK